jgi:DNA-binding IclR family transcriptional regulator
MVKSADRVIKILEYVGQKGEGYTHIQIASALQIPKSSLTALLANLIQTEYLTYDPNTKRYSLGPQLLYLAGRFLENLDIVSIGQPFVKRLSQMTNESVALAIPSGNDVLFVCKENSPQPILRSLEVGARLPAYATAAGKAIMAFWPHEKIEGYLASENLMPITKNTVIQADRIRAELDAIRQGGLSYSRDGFQEGVSAFGRPVFDAHGGTAASLAISGPSFRIDNEKEELIEKSLLRIAEELSHQLGFHGRALAGGLGR